MPRHPTLSVLLAATTLTLAAALPLARLAARDSASASTGPASAHPASADAVSAAHAPVTVTLYHSSLAWRTAPWLFVSAVVTHAEGIRSDGRGGVSGREGSGHGRARRDGWVDVQLNGGSGRLFRPYDTVSIVTGSFITPQIGVPLTFIVPELRVDVSADRTAVEGVAAPGTAVTIAVDPSPGGGATTPLQTVLAGPTGRFRWAVGEGMQLAPGQGGWAIVRDADGNAFRARFAAFQLRIGLGRATGAGWLTPAADLDVRYGALRTDGRLRMVGHNAVSRTPDGRRRYVAASPSSSIAGTACTVTIVSSILSPRSRAFLLPTLSVETAAADRAAGTAPPGAAIAVEVFAADDGTDNDADRDVPPIARIAVTADAAGRWDVDLPAAAPHRPGGRIEAVLDLGDGLEVAAAAIWPRFTVAVEGARVSADAPSKGRYILTVRAPDGALIGRTGTLGTDADDRMTIDLGPEGSWYAGDPVLPDGMHTALLRGGTIEVDSGVGGEPLRLDIPNLRAAADADAEAFAGTAPAGADLDIEVIGPFGARRFAATADASGQWSLPLAGRIDVGSGVGARIWYADRAGHRFYVDSAVVQIRADTERSMVEAAPWIGRAMYAEVVDATGRVVGSAAMPADEGPDDDERWQVRSFTNPMEIFDRRGNDVPLQAGDTIRVRLGDDEAAWVLPPIEARLHPDRSLVVGRTSPGAHLEVIAGELDDPLTVSTTVTAGADGTFSADLDGRVSRASIDLMEGVYVRGTFGRHVLLRFVLSAGMTFDADRSLVSGVLEPNVEVVALLLAGDTVRASGRVQTGSRGRFTVELRDAAGAGVIAHEGDRLTVEAAAAVLYPRMELIVPRLSIERGPPDRTIVGDRPAEGQLSVGNSTAHWTWPVGGASNGISVDEVRSEAGRWTAFLNGGVVPGDVFGVSLFLGNGHVVERRLVLPILAVEHGGPQVCGFGPALGDASLALVGADGTTRASVAGPLSADGTIDARWADGAGRPVHSRAGDRVVGRVGDADIEIEMGVLTATLDLAGSRLFSRVRPGLGAKLTSPTRDCLYRLRADDEHWLAARGLYAATHVGSSKREPPGEGQVVLQLPTAPLAERGVDMHLASTSRHRIFRTVYHALTLEADVTAGRIAGGTRPHADVRLTVTSPDGAVRAVIAALADASGAFIAPTVDDIGRPIALTPGDRIAAYSALAPGADVVDGIGPETATMTIDDLAVDAGAGAIVGRAPAGRRVWLALDVGVLGRRWLSATATVDGVFAVRDDDLPVRGGWTLADVRAVRAEVGQDGGHLTVVRGSRATHALFLPWGERGE
ncbi:MAG: hypothetical protein IPG72_03855 [Ardenticatenales bacterium]|nr:hypothetical protein [Ardenticatenales bacterium]